MHLEILYHDERLIAINKPNGLLVHKTNIAADAREFALQILRDQIGQQVYPTHRLDRKTSGVLLFALDKEMNASIQKLFAENKIKKQYLAIVRGFSPDEGMIDYPLKMADGSSMQALTRFRTLERTELDLAFAGQDTSRYSLVEVSPESGRTHQIRRHFAHILHPIIGDRPHGCNKQNKLFREKWGMTTMLLHAREIKFQHPGSEGELIISAPLPPEFIRMLGVLGFKSLLEYKTVKS